MDAGGVVSGGERRLAALGAALSALLVAAAVILAFVGDDSGGGPSHAAGETRIVGVAGIEALEAKLGHPIYWVGERAGEELELTEEADGSVFLRYLPQGTGAGQPHTYFLTVGTYPVADAQAALRRAAANAEVQVSPAERGAVTFVDPAAPQSAYLAYPGSDLEIEVYDPVAGKSLRMVESGLIEPVG